MNTQIETILEITKGWLVQQGYIGENGCDENAPLELDSFAYLSFIVQLEDRLNVEVKADLFFGQGTGEEYETFSSLCHRLKRSIVAP